MASTHIGVRLHLAWSTKRRAPSIRPEWHGELFDYIGGIIRAKGGSLLEVGGVEDHIHIYVALPSTISLSELVNAVKANSSRWLRRRFVNGREFRWQSGYSAFSVGPSGDGRLRDYIRNQGKHHANRDFQKELIAFLEYHRVAYDPRYFCD